MWLKNRNQYCVTTRCSDTDVLIIMLGNIAALKSKLEIKVPLGTGINQRYDDINELFDKLGEQLCLVLPAFYAVTSCDFNSAFYRKGIIATNITYSFRIYRSTD